MKLKNYLLFIFAFVITNSVVLSQELERCFTNIPEPEGEQLPGYLQEWWGQQRTVPVAVVYLDFPDGRFGPEGALKQPFSTSELEDVSNLDAVGEIGLTHVVSPYPAGNGLYTNAAKYTRSDRWNMFFSYGIYRNEAHPDFETHGGPPFNYKAFGNMAEYFKEVSNEKLIIVPAVTQKYS